MAAPVVVRPGRERLVRSLPGEHGLVRPVADRRPGTRAIDGRRLPEHAAGRRRPVTPAGRLAGSLATFAVVGALAGLLGWQPVEPLAAAPPNAAPSIPPVVDVAPSTGPEPTTGGGMSAEPASAADAVRWTTGGEVVRWSCEQAITVRLSPDAPAGARTDLADAVATLAAASGLPLVLAEGGTDDGAASSVITVTYAPRPDLAASVLGRGGVSFLPTTGEVVGGTVTMRTDGDPFPVGSPEHRRALLHELGHAVGLLHAEEDSEELMAPTLTPGLLPEEEFVLGDGDRAALALVGCPR